MGRIGKRKPETPSKLGSADNLEGLSYLDRMKEKDRSGRSDGFDEEGRGRKKGAHPFGKTSKHGKRGEPEEPERKRKSLDDVKPSDIKAIPAEVIEDMPAIKTDDEGRPIGPNRKPMRLRRRLKPQKPGILSTLLPAIGLLIGAVVLAWPIVTDLYQSAKYSGAISSVEETYNYEEPEFQEMLEQADLYNQSLVGMLPAGTDPTTIRPYEEQLAYNEAGMMSWVEIPILSMKLPIYHGADEEALMAGVGHIEGTSLPVGGEHTKCVISGHSGMQNERMFDSIGDLKEGDTVIIHTLSRELYYSVESQEVVLPTEIDKLKIDNEDSELILVTCTPYGVNTHRRLVHCKQVDHKPEEPSPIQRVGKYMMGRNAIAFVGLCVVVLIAFLWFMFGGARKKQKEAEEKEKKRLDDGKKQAEALLVIQLKNEFDEDDDPYKSREAEARKSRWAKRSHRFDSDLEQEETEEAARIRAEMFQMAQMGGYASRLTPEDQEWMKENNVPTQMPMMASMPQMPNMQTMPNMPMMPAIQTNQVAPVYQTQMPVVPSAPEGMKAISVIIDPVLAANHSVHLMLENNGDEAEQIVEQIAVQPVDGEKDAQDVAKESGKTGKSNKSDKSDAENAAKDAEPAKSEETPKSTTKSTTNTGNTQKIQLAKLEQSLAALTGVVERLVQEMEAKKGEAQVDEKVDDLVDEMPEADIPAVPAEDEADVMGDEIDRLIDAAHDKGGAIDEGTDEGVTEEIDDPQDTEAEVGAESEPEEVAEEGVEEAEPVAEEEPSIPVDTEEETESPITETIAVAEMSAAEEEADGDEEDDTDPIAEFLEAVVIPDDDDDDDAEDSAEEDLAEALVDGIWTDAPAIRDLIDTFVPRGEERIYDDLRKDAQRLAPTVVKMFEDMIEEEEREAEAQRIFDELLQTQYGPITVRVLDKILTEVKSEEAQADELDERDSFFIACDLLYGENGVKELVPETQEATQGEESQATEGDAADKADGIDEIDELDAFFADELPEEDVEADEELGGEVDTDDCGTDDFVDYVPEEQEDQAQTKQTKMRIQVPTRHSGKGLRKGWTTVQKPLSLGDFGQDDTRTGRWSSSQTGSKTTRETR